MIFQASRLAINANRMHSFNQIGRVWWQSDFKRNMHLLLNKALINGEWVSAESQAELPVINPANGSIVGHVPDLDVNDVRNAIDAAHKTFHSDEWSSLTAKERSALLKVSLFLFDSYELIDDTIKFVFCFRNGTCYLKAIATKLLQS